MAKATLGTSPRILILAKFWASGIIEIPKSKPKLNVSKTYVDLSVEYNCSIVVLILCPTKNLASSRFTWN